MQNNKAEPLRRTFVCQNPTLLPANRGSRPRNAAQVYGGERGKKVESSMPEVPSGSRGWCMAVRGYSS